MREKHILIQLYNLIKINFKVIITLLTHISNIAHLWMWIICSKFHKNCHLHPIIRKSFTFITPKINQVAQER